MPRRVLRRTVQVMPALRTRTLPAANLCAWTALTPAQFTALTARLWKLRPDTGRGRPWALAFTDRVLLLTLGYRTNLNQRQLAALFAVSQSQVDRIAHDLALHLAALLGPPPVDRRELWIAGGTMIPVHDHGRSAKSRNYRRSVNVQVIARARDRRVIAVGTARPGNRHDVIVFRETLAGQPGVREHRRLSGDGGYRGAPQVRGPVRGAGGRIVRDRAYQRFTKRRAVIEHTLARLKDWQILRQCRRPGTGIDLAVAGVAVLHNLRLELP